MNKICEEVERSIKEEFPEMGEVGYDDNLQDYGLNSVNIIKLILRLEESYNINLDELIVDLVDDITINNITALIEERIKS